MAEDRDCEDSGAVRITKVSETQRFQYLLYSHGFSFLVIAYDMILIYFE